MVLRMLWSFKMVHPTTEKTQCSLFTSLNSYFESNLYFVTVASGFDWGFRFLLPVVADCAVSCLGSVILFGLQSISLWSNLLSVCFIPVFLLLSMQKLLYPVLLWQIVVIQGASGLWNPGLICTDEVDIVCGYK